MRNFLGSTPMARCPPIILASNQFRHLTMSSSFRDVNTDILCTIQDSRIASLVVVNTGLEPMTYSVSGNRSNQLS